MRALVNVLLIRACCFVKWVNHLSMFGRYKQVYALGIHGAGMSGLVRMLADYGLSIFGYDRVPSDTLQDQGYVISYLDNVDAIPKAVRNHLDKTLVVTTPAIAESHPLLCFFKQAGCRVYLRAEVLAWIANATCCLAVAGTHGKTTTSALIAHILYESGWPMMALVGGMMQNYHTNYLCTTALPAPYAVVEADEFNRSFLSLWPSCSIITSVDGDHLECYGDLASFYGGFRQFIDQTKDALWIHDGAVEKLGLSHLSGKTVVRYGLNKGQVYAGHIRWKDQGSVFDYISPDGVLPALSLPLLGHYNIENALAAVGVCLAWGIEEAKIRRGLACFSGVKRRLTWVYQDDYSVLIEDYAHHPIEVAALLGAIRQYYTESKLTVIFQPHLFSRTQRYYRDFAQVLSGVDQLLLLPIYPAREEPIPGISSALIIERALCARKQLVDAGHVWEHLFFYPKPTHHVVLVVGAGDIDQILPFVKKALVQRALER